MRCCCSRKSGGMLGLWCRKVASVECVGRGEAVDVEAAALRDFFLRGHGPCVVWATWLPSVLVVSMLVVAPTAGLWSACLFISAGESPVCSSLSSHDFFSAVMKGQLDRWSSPPPHVGVCFGWLTFAVVFNMLLRVCFAPCVLVYGCGLGPCCFGFCPVLCN